MKGLLAGISMSSWKTRDEAVTTRRTKVNVLRGVEVVIRGEVHSSFCLPFASHHSTSPRALPTSNTPLQATQPLTPNTTNMSSEGLENAPTGEVQDNAYISRSGTKHEPMPVQSDNDKVEDPIDENKADTDEQLRMVPPVFPTSIISNNYQSAMMRRPLTRAIF